MKRYLPILVLPLVGLISSGCAGHDYRGERLLGSATDKNIQLHSVRNDALPNNKEIDGGQGGTGANAVAALRQGQTKPAGSPKE